MGFFNKILVQELKTGNLIDITNLDQQHYESFLDAVDKIRVAYKEAIGQKKDESLIELKANVEDKCSHDNTEFRNIRCNSCTDCGELVEIDV